MHPPAGSRDDAAIVTDGLFKTFMVPVREPGLRAALRAVVRREHREVHAVDDVSFTIRRGEVVGFLGPNGAGKTTTLKMLSGLLHASGGELRVLGHVPQRRDPAFLQRISLVMGQRHQLLWDIPAGDSFEMLRAIYAIPQSVCRRRLDELAELLDIGAVIDKPVRQLSLGERMKCELAGALLHAPEVLFLDEPTLGLDVGAQRRLREFIGGYARRTGATVLLTSHYMADIEALAERVIVIHHGRLQYDGALAALARRISDRKVVRVRLDPGAHPARDEQLARRLVREVGDVRAVGGAELVLEVPRTELRARLGVLLGIDELIDFTVEDEPIERLVERVFAEGVRPAASVTE